MQPEALNAEGKRNNIENGYRLLVWPDLLKGLSLERAQKEETWHGWQGEEKIPPGVWVGNGCGLGLGGQL